MYDLAILRPFLLTRKKNVCVLEVTVERNAMERLTNDAFPLKNAYAQQIPWQFYGILGDMSACNVF